ncbi:hypothetical protein DAPPUDRAFT_59833, partial [Daphnia pulex]
VRTMARRTLLDGIYPIYALHCDYCLTTSGPAIMRVVVISSDCEKIYETFVRQDNLIMQFGTRFVRISLSDLLLTWRQPSDVQHKLSELICDKTILIGHVVQYALLALRMTHDTVVDTSVVFRSCQPAIATRKSLR